MIEGFIVAIIGIVIGAVIERRYPGKFPLLQWAVAKVEQAADKIETK